MEHAEFLPAIGSVYQQRGSHLRVVATSDGGCALLEQWVADQLNQYIVASHFILQDDELHWLGNGAYFPCKYPPPVCDTPIDALQKALDYMRGSRKVYVLISNTDYGMDASLHSTEEMARAAMQHALDHNDNVQATAAKIGIERLTVDAYFENTASGELELFDAYSIVERDIH